MTKFIRIAAFAVVLSFVSGFAECYKPVTKNQLPARIKTVAVPAFQIETQALRYKVESRFTDAVMRELIHRGRGLRVQGEREGADAVIEGVIKSFNFAGVLLDDPLAMEATTDRLLSYVLDVASGRTLTNNERNDVREIAIWKEGVTL